MAYKINFDELEDKIKYIKPNSLTQAISKKFQNSSYFKDTIEESLVIDNKETNNNFEEKAKFVEEAYGNNLKFMNKIYSKLAKTNKIIEEQKELVKESFNKNVFVLKTERDLQFFKDLIETTFADMPRIKEEMYNKIKEILVEAIELYKETNTKPRFINPNLVRQDLTENEIINIYKKNFKNYLEKNYLKKIKSNQLEENEINEIKQFTKFLVENNYNVNLDEIMVYYPFEKALASFFESIIIPDLSKRKIQLFMESQHPDYFELFDKNAKTLMESIEEKIAKIASMLAPFLFKDIVDADIEKPEKYAGISIVCKKVNDGPMICEVNKKDDTEAEEINQDIDTIDDDLEDDEAAVEAAAEDEAKMIDDFTEDKDLDKKDKKDQEESSIPASEDKDHDGKPDAEEDHGPLPDDFEGDHKDAEKWAKEHKKENKNKKSMKEESTVEETAMTSATRTLITAEQTKKDLGISNDRNTDDPKLLKEADKEEIIKDEADNVKTLGDAAKEEK